MFLSQELVPRNSSHEGTSPGDFTNWFEFVGLVPVTKMFLCWVAIVLTNGLGPRDKALNLCMPALKALSEHLPMVSARVKTIQEKNWALYRKRFHEEN